MYGIEQRTYQAFGSRPVGSVDPIGLQTCAAEYCTTTGPLPEVPEGTILFRAEVVGDKCGKSGTKVKFYLKETTYLGPGKFVLDKNGVPSPCGQPVNTELKEILPDIGFRYGDILTRRCTAPSKGGNFRHGKDSHGCYWVEWTWECRLNCPKGKCDPLQFKMGIYGPRASDDPHRPRPGGTVYGISAYSLQTAANLTIVEKCCAIESCTINLSLDWQSFYYDTPGAPPDFEPIRSRSPAPNNCSAADRQRVIDAEGR